MTLSSIQKRIVFISSIVAGLGVILGGVYNVYSWADSTIVTKDELMIAVTDIRLGQIEESLARYHDIGLKNLSDTQKHRYDKLILAETANDEQRKILLGL